MVWKKTGFGFSLGKALLLLQGEEKSFDLPYADVSEGAGAECGQDVVLEVSAALLRPAAAYSLAP
ncbi:MAG: hypothetical protein ABSB63_04785 [Spirochaetia bacterium]|jgi:hypothetical protein